MLKRFAIWALIGSLLAISFGDRWYWLAFVAGFWLLGAVCLRCLTAVQLGELNRTVRTSRSARAGLLLGTAVLAVTGWWFGAIAALLGLTIVTSLALLSGLRRGPTAALDLVTGLSLAGTTVLAAGFAGEWIVSRPAIGAEWGSPAELSAWQGRYDSLARPGGNLFGFRSPYEQIAKDSGVYRVFVLGDSFTWGDKIARTEDTWPAELERLLQKAYPGTRIEVVNAAHKGYTTANEAELMRRLGWQFDPDVLLVQFYENDAYLSLPGFQHLDAVDVYRQYHILPYRFRFGGAAESSALLKFIDGKLQRALGEQDPASFYEDGRVGWRQLVVSLQELGSEAAARGVPAILLMVPDLPWGAFTVESHPNQAMHAKVERMARKAGFEVLDLTPVFADSATEGREWWATAYDPHPSEVGHGLIAREAFRFIAAHGATP